MAASLPWQANTQALIFYTKTGFSAMDESASSYSLHSIPEKPAGPKRMRQAVALGMTKSLRKKRWLRFGHPATALPSPQHG
jgi:hypothetical protein